jgi:hypothetical protein
MELVREVEVEGRHEVGDGVVEVHREMACRGKNVLSESGVSIRSTVAGASASAGRNGSGR